MSKEDRELIYALWAMEILVRSGIGLETAMKHVAEGDYGIISKKFNKILSSTEIEKGMRESLQETKSKSLREAYTTLLNCMKRDASVSESIKTIAERETQNRKMKTRKFIGTLTVVSELFLTLGVIIPIIAVVLPFMGVMGVGGLPVMDNENRIIVPDLLLQIVNIILVVILFILGMMVFYIKNKEINL